MRFMFFAAAFLVAGIMGCTHVDVTKTAKGFNQPTDPDSVEVLMTKPDRVYAELGSVTASGFDASETASLHNALRSKAAPLGADAVIILTSGQIPGGFGSMKIWANAVAIKFQPR